MYKKITQKHIKKETVQERIKFLSISYKKLLLFQDKQQKLTLKFSQSQLKSRHSNSDRSRLSGHHAFKCASRSASTGFSKCS